jgi:hypothetical protein
LTGINRWIPAFKIIHLENKKGKIPMKTNFEAICKQELNDLKRKKQGDKHRDFDDIIEQIFSYPNCHGTDEFDDINFETITKNAMIRKNCQLSGVTHQILGVH